MISVKNSSLSTISFCDSPDPRLTHEIESGTMNHCGALALRIGSEKDRGAKDPLERTHKPPILRSTLLHAEGVQHLRRASEPNQATLLFDGKSRAEDRHQPVLAPRQPVCRVSGHLKKKLPVPALMQELPRLRLLHR
jgi:hypothetical protein